MLSILKLIRIPNLFIIAATMFLMRYCIIEPIAITMGLSLVFPTEYFSVLVFSVLLITAAGYIINDYFDIRIDTINKPSRATIVKRIGKQKLFFTYFIFNGIALLIIAFIGYYYNFWNYFFLAIAVIGILWFYSTTYKEQLFVGNFIVSIFTALVTMLPVMYDVPLMNRAYHQLIIIQQFNLKIIFIWCAAFALFALLTNLLREIVKDAEDFEGDTISGRNTVPIVYGSKITNIVLVCISLIIISLISFFFLKYLKYNFDGTFDYISFFYFLVLLIVPTIISLFFILKSTKNGYSNASLMIKISMIAGILFSIVVRYKIMN